MEINPEQGSLHGDAVEISKPTMSNLAVSGVTTYLDLKPSLGCVCAQASRQAAEGIHKVAAECNLDASFL
jgi:hypothetical protein